jgi:hypothetical protein
MVMPAQNNPDPQGVFATEQNGFVVCRERTCRSVRMNVFAEDLAIQCAVCGTFPWLQPAVDGIPEFGTALARAMQATANADAAGDQVDADQSMAPARWKEWTKHVSLLQSSGSCMKALQQSKPESEGSVTEQGGMQCETLAVSDDKNSCIVHHEQA